MVPDWNSAKLNVPILKEAMAWLQSSTADEVVFMSSVCVNCWGREQLPCPHFMAASPGYVRPVIQTTA
jgi:hypothetical protein